MRPEGSPGGWTPGPLARTGVRAVLGVVLLGSAAWAGGRLGPTGEALVGLGGILLLAWVVVVDLAGLGLRRLTERRPGLARRPAIRIVRDPGARVGATLVVLFAGTALLASLIAPNDPMATSAPAQLVAPDLLGTGEVGPDRPWRPLGGDALGRCVLSRIVHGARISLVIGLLSIAFATLAGVPLGLVAGYLGERTLDGRSLGRILAGVSGAVLLGCGAGLAAGGLGIAPFPPGPLRFLAILAAGGLLLGGLADVAGRRGPLRSILARPLLTVDTLVSRTVDLLLAFPAIVLAITIMAVAGRSVTNVILAVAVVNVPIIVRQVRASALETRERAFVVAARALGARDRRIMFRTILPSCLAPVCVLATLGIGSAILSAAGLSFLGLGTEPGLPEWGAMLAETRDHIGRAPWVVLGPGVALTLAVLGFNLLGDALRDAVDPKGRRIETP